MSILSQNRPKLAKKWSVFQKIRLTTLEEIWTSNLFEEQDMDQDLLALASWASWVKCTQSYRVYKHGW